jgi:hypothetical protein
MTESEKFHLREVSLKMARELHPNTYSQGSAFYPASQANPPSVETIIKTSQVIFDWLKGD